MFALKAAAVATVHIPFSGDNHTDPGLANETAQTVSGVATLATMMQQLQSANMSDQVTFASLNVFGRTLGLADNGLNGRDHNANHHCGLIIGPAVKGSVIGGIGVVGADFGALPINSSSGVGGAGGDIAAVDSLAAYALTLGTALGIPSATLSANIVSATGKVVTAALQNP